VGQRHHFAGSISTCIRKATEKERQMLPLTEARDMELETAGVNLPLLDPSGARQSAKAGVRKGR